MRDRQRRLRFCCIASSGALHQRVAGVQLQRQVGRSPCIGSSIIRIDRHRAAARPIWQSTRKAARCAALTRPPNRTAGRGRRRRSGRDGAHLLELGQKILMMEPTCSSDSRPSAPSRASAKTPVQNPPRSRAPASARRRKAECSGKAGAAIDQPRPTTNIVEARGVAQPLIGFDPRPKRPGSPPCRSKAPSSGSGSDASRRRHRRQSQHVDEGRKGRQREARRQQKADPQPGLVRQRGKVRHSSRILHGSCRDHTIFSAAWPQLTIQPWVAGPVRHNHPTKRKGPRRGFPRGLSQPNRPDQIGWSPVASMTRVGRPSLPSSSRKGGRAGPRH